MSEVNFIELNIKKEEDEQKTLQQEQQQQQQQQQNLDDVKELKYKFKNKNYQLKKLLRTNNSSFSFKQWKSLKQILLYEKNLLPLNSTSYSSIIAPPSFKPPLKYSDISGTNNSSFSFKQWKSLKQILYEKNLLPINSTSYSSIIAPPSFKPPLKYSDISGYQCNYKDSQTKLYYANVKEYEIIKKLPSDIVNSYLLLRGALNPLA